MKSRWLPLIVSLLLAGVLALLVDDLFYRLLISPALYVFWLVTLLLESVAQVLYWAAFILVTLIIVAWSLPRDKAVRSKRRVPLSSNRGAVATWSVLLKGGDEPGPPRWYLAQSLRKLAWNVLLPGKRARMYMMEEQLREAQLTLSPEIMAYFRASMPGFSSTVRPWRRRRRVDDRFQILDLDPEKVVAYLEDRLDPLAKEGRPQMNAD